MVGELLLSREIRYVLLFNTLDFEVSITKRLLRESSLERASVILPIIEVLGIVDQVTFPIDLLLDVDNQKHPKQDAFC